MRTPASLVHRYFAVVPLGAALALSCGGDSKQSESDSGSAAGDGSGNASSGGTSSGGATATGGSESGGTSGTSTGGLDTGGAPTGGRSDGGTSNGGTSNGGTSNGGDAGMPATGGTAGSSSGGSSGSSGASGGGLAGMPSTGCNSAQVPTSGRFTINVAGTARDYILRLPTGYDVTRPRSFPLLILLHGRMYSAQSVADGGAPGMTGPYYGLEAAAGADAILVAAQALSTSWTNESGRDVAYLSAMLARFESQLCVDRSRLFAVGFSMGAIMTLTAGCDATSVFRAIAPMSASLPSNCSSTGPALAYWGSHGTNDTTILPAQGEAVRDSFVAKNGCDATTTPGDRAGCVNYQGCDAGAPVTWCTFTGVHEPPPFAGAAIWTFFSQF